MEHDRSDRDGEVVAVSDLFGLDGGGDDEEGGDEEFEVLVHRARGSMPTMSDVGKIEGDNEDEDEALFDASNVEFCCGAAMIGFQSLGSYRDRETRWGVAAKSSRGSPITTHPSLVHGIYGDQL